MKYIFILLAVLFVSCKTRKTVTSDKYATTARIETKTDGKTITESEVVNTTRAGVTEAKTETLTDTTITTETTVFAYDTARGKAYPTETRKTVKNRKHSTANLSKTDTGTSATQTNTRNDSDVKTTERKTETTLVENKRKDVDRKINPFVIGGSIVLLIIAFIFVYRRITS